MAAAATARGTSWSRVVLPRCTRPGGRGRTPAVRAPRRSPAPDGAVKTRGRRHSPRAISAFDPSPDAVLAVLATCAAGAKLAEEKTKFGAKVSAPLLAMASAMLLATLGLIPAASPALDLVWRALMPLAVALSLLGVDLRDAARTSGPALAAFAVGAVGSVLGTAVAYATVGRALGPDAWRVAACLCASYVGGSLNYAATAQALGLAAAPGGQAALAAGMAADNLAMAVFLSALMVAKADPPTEEEKAFASRAMEDGGDGIVGEIGGNEGVCVANGGTVPTAVPTARTAACALATALVFLECGKLLARCLGLPAGTSLGVSSALVPVAAAAAATATRGALDASRAFAGSDAVGGALMLVFFAALGASADPRVAIKAGGPACVFIAVQLATHLAFVAAVGVGAMRLPAWAVLTASNACVGGPATAAAMASARGWTAAVQPAIVAGTIGYAVGTPIGCLVGQALRAWF